MKKKKTISNTKKKMSKTEKKHRAFAKHYVMNGYDHTFSYSVVYDNKSLVTSKQRGHALLNSLRVKQYINEYEDSPLTQKITKEEIVFDLYKLKDECLNDGKVTSALKAIETLNKMLGYNEAEKQVVDTTIRFQFGGLEYSDDNEIVWGKNIGDDDDDDDDDDGYDFDDIDDAEII